ncbi:c-1-tetrahydrofolate synthase cytoplasmic-related [Holotrichia oblita]|nr:c-1-tetrahydrofolate synthase cytoplasmic-related [Holotrichia oblita]
MSAQIIDGKKIAAAIREELKVKAFDFEKKYGYKAGLAVVRVGEDPASVIYVNNKIKACEETGLKSFSYLLPDNISKNELKDLIMTLNADKYVHGILVQLPLPKQLDEREILSLILPEKDVDGFHTINAGKLFLGEDALAACTPAGCIELIKSTGHAIQGKHAVVQGITAGAEIAQAIKDISQLKDIDAVIIARGGGSDGDLSCFNAETVVRAVYDCGYYIISAVGHETDYTLCDYAADMRAPTPSAAAELLVDCISEDYNKLYNLSAAAEQAFDGLFYRKLKHPKNAAYIINASINYRIQSMNNNILIYNERTRAACRKLLDDKEKAVKTAETVINNLNPMKLISNGYARITRNSAIISGVQDLNIKDNIKIYMSDGTVDAEIVINKLEDKETTLDDGVTEFDKAAVIIEQCLNILEQSKGKYTEIQKRLNKLTERVFEKSENNFENDGE